MKEGHVSCLFKDTRMNKAFLRPQSNTHKHKCKGVHIFGMQKIFAQI